MSDKYTLHAYEKYPGEYARVLVEWDRGHVKSWTYAEPKVLWIFQGVSNVR